MLETGKNICYCTVCGEYFQSDTSFMRHRRGPVDDRSCMTPGEMIAVGMERNKQGRWITGTWKHGGRANGLNRSQNRV